MEASHPVVIAQLREHDLSDERLLHTDIQPSLCICRASRTTAQAPSVHRETYGNGTSHHSKPSTAGLPDGGVCFACGGLTVRTGTCTTCVSCFLSSGCS